ncbi:MAG: thioredoxin domain-containing protein, partial [Anaerolineales bacterium]
LEDYAALILALLALYQTDPDVRWYSQSEKLLKEMLAYFSDPNGGFFDTRDDHETLITRPKDLQDNATPSGNALAALALLQMSKYSGNGEWRDRAERMVAGIQAAASRYPTSFAQWLCASNFALADGREIALVNKETSKQVDKELTGMLDNVWSEWRPFDVVAVSSFPSPNGSPALLVDRPLKDDKATAYVCRGFVCDLPVNSAEELRAQLAAT